MDAAFGASLFFPSFREKIPSFFPSLDFMTSFLSFELFQPRQPLPGILNFGAAKAS
jgi:hypothetical protein